MSFFTPPLRDGNPMTSPEAGPTANALMRHYDNWAQGVTVWKDSNGVFHESLTPYEGGATHATHNLWANGVGPTSVTTGPDEGLATAVKVYLGGHVHPITPAEEAELIAAGYAANITP